jgi:signal peptidase II
MTSNDADPSAPIPVGRDSRRWVVIAVVTAFMVAADQLSKHWAVGRLSSPGSRVELVGGLEFRLAFNQGMAFSRFSNSGPLIAVAALVIVAAVIWFARQLPGTFSWVVVGCVAGGALGNVLDRMFRTPAPGNPAGFLRGAVVDFIWTSWWPTFNVADSAVVVGGILLAIIAWRLPDPKQPAAAELERGASADESSG